MCGAVSDAFLGRSLGDVLVRPAYYIISYLAGCFGLRVAQTLCQFLQVGRCIVYFRRSLLSVLHFGLSILVCMLPDWFVLHFGRSLRAVYWPTKLTEWLVGNFQELLTHY